MSAELENLLPTIEEKFCKNVEANVANMVEDVFERGRFRERFVFFSATRVIWFSCRIVNNCNRDTSYKWSPNPNHKRTACKEEMPPNTFRAWRAISAKEIRPKTTACKEIQSQNRKYKGRRVHYWEVRNRPVETDTTHQRIDLRPRCERTYLGRQRQHLFKGVDEGRQCVQERLIDITWRFQITRVAYGLRFRLTC